ncbi:MAG: hypothetical protein AAGF28_00545 [Pseudomonadota bacterium]
MSGPAQKPPSHKTLDSNLIGAAEMMLGRQSGLSKLDLSAAGVGLSFYGLLLTGLIDAASVSITFDAYNAAETDPTTGKPTYILGSLISAFAGYAASLFALYLLCRTPQEQARFPIALVAQNWASPVLSLVFLPIFWITSVLAVDQQSGASLAPFLVAGSIAILVLAGVRLLRISLDVTLAKAVALFLMTTAVSIVVREGFSSLLGL